MKLTFLLLNVIKGSIFKYETQVEAFSGAMVMLSGAVVTGTRSSNHEFFLWFL